MTDERPAPLADLRVVDLWKKGDFRTFVAMLPEYAEACHGEGKMHDTAMLLGALGTALGIALGIAAIAGGAIYIYVTVGSLLWGVLATRFGLATSPSSAITRCTISIGGP